MIRFIKKYKTYLIGIILGAIAGYLYWYFIGCSSGSCIITSKWYNTVLYGILVGFLLGIPRKPKPSIHTGETTPDE